MSEWTENFENDIKVQIESIKRLEAGYINVRLLNNTAKKIDQLANNCAICKQYKTDYDALLPELVKRIEEPQFRNEYEQKLVEVVKHLEKEHQLLPKSYFASLYTLIGLVSVSILALLFTYFYNKELLMTALLYGAFTGLIIGRVLGMLKDKKQAKEGLSI